MSLIGLLARGFGVIYPEAGELPQIATEIAPEQSSFIGCVDPNQQPAYLVPASFGGILDWTVRSQDGTVVNVASTGAPAEEDITSKWDRVALFHDPFCVKSIYVGRLAENGRGGLKVFVPQCVESSPGIYQVEVHWRNPGTPDQHYFNTGIVSVEDSIYNRAVTGIQQGAIPLSRIRQKMRDYSSANDISGFPEFSFEEILSAMLEPVEYYNEVPPHVQHYSPQNFPYRQQWLEATVSKLLMTSSLWMQRNQVRLQGEGVGADDRDKWKAMQQLSAKLWSDYQAFVRNDKVRINITRGFGIV